MVVADLRVPSCRRMACVAALLLLSGAAGAETLRCNGQSADEGDTRLWVLYKCGEPLLRDSYCAPIVQGPGYQPIPWSLAMGWGACQPVEEWLYDRGPGNLTATVRFRGGVVHAILYGQTRR